MVNLMKRIMRNQKKNEQVSKYYRKVNCCDDQGSDEAFTVRTCGKSIPGSNKGCDAHTLSANTVLKQNYYTTNSQYLQSRCKTFKQRSFNFSLDSSGNANANCTQSGNVSGDCKKVIYKPSNAKYSVQGAVSSSTRLLRLKYDSIVSKNNGNPCSSCSRYPPLYSKNEDLKKGYPACTFKRKC